MCKNNMLLNIVIINFIFIPVLCIDDVTKDLLTPIFEYGEACGYMACPNPSPDALNVHIVPSTHGELGYTRTFYQHYTGLDEYYAPSKVNMKNIFDAVITELWTSEARKFALSDITYFFYWWKNRDATVRRMVYQLLRQGRLYFVGGGWGMSDESVAHYHAIIDQFTFSLRKLNATFMECGRPLVSWQADTFGHSREFASLMAQMGFDGHFINPISFDDELARMRSKSLEFVWRGSDDLGMDSDIYTHKLFDGYWSPPGFCFGSFCSDPLIVTSDTQFSNVEDRVKAFTKLMVERQGPYYTTKNVMVVMGQRLGYHDAKTWFANIDKLINIVNARQRDAIDKLYLFYSSPACYLKAVQKAQPGLRTKQDDFFPLAYDKNTHATGMYTSRPVIKYLAREIHVLVQIAKQLQVFAKLKDNSRRFEEIQWIAGVINDHTILTGAMRQHVSDYYAQKVHKAKEICMQMFRPAFNILRNAPRSTLYYMCPFNASSCWTISGDTSFIVVYNPLAWPVTLPVRLPVDKTQYFLYDPKGNHVNHSITPIPELVKYLPERSKPDHEPALDDELVFLAEKVPPMGFRSYFLEKTIIRGKRSLIKKLTKKKKYLTRQTNSLKLEDEGPLDYAEYEYFEDASIKPAKIEFGNVTQGQRPMKPANDYILTPRPKTTQHPEFVKELETTSEINEEADMDVEETTRAQKPTTTSRPEIKAERRSGYSQTFAPEVYDEKVEKTTVPSDEYLQEQIYRRMEESGYFGTQSKDRFIKNEYIRINLNRDFSKITSMMLSNGITIYLEMKLMFYVSDDPEKMNTGKKRPGPYVFRPMDPDPVDIKKNPSTKIFKSEFVEEVHLQFAPFAGIAVKLYKSLPYVELDWLVGPIPVQDKLGKDIFIRYTTDLVNNGVFYTDANGRQTMKRIKDLRATYTPMGNDNIAGNFYPVTSKVYIEDTAKNIRFSVFPDRGEGCTSLAQGELDIMLHRRILTDDSGIQSFLNETEFDRGLVVRGKHRLYLSKADFRPNKVYEKKLAKELELQPYIFTSSHPYYANISYSKWLTCNNEYSALKKKMPIGVHILTVENWHDQLLIRLENYLEKSDIVRTGIKNVYLKDIFKDYKMLKCKETMLAANIWREEYVQMSWQKDKFVYNFNDIYGNSSNLEFADDQYKEYQKVEMLKSIELAPQQIRTFVCSYIEAKYVKNYKR